MRIHQGLAPSRWFQFTLFEQLGNVGSDIDRAISWRKKGDFDYSKQAFDRALELLNWTIKDPKNRGPRLRELCRVREAVIDYFMYDNRYCSTDEDWQKYFFNFAYMAALAKGR
jgi:hypothetical protein